MKGKWVTTGLTAIALLACSNGDHVVDTQGEPTALVIAIPLSKAAADEVARVVYTIAGAGMTTLTGEAEIGTDNVVRATIAEVPPGTERVVTFEALDSAGEVVFSGTATTDVVAGKTSTVAIVLSRLLGMPQLRVTPDEVEASPGETFTVGVDLRGGRNLIGIALEVAYLDTLLSMTRAEAGDVLGDGALSLVHSEVGLPATQLIDSVSTGVSAGRVSISVAMQGADEPFSGSGRVATIEFEALAAGDTPIRIVTQWYTEETIGFARGMRPGLERADGTYVPVMADSIEITESIVRIR
ncbi:cohesin domain-containing protein [Candidatus Latescibacterota bacterium]